MEARIFQVTRQFREKLAIHTETKLASIENNNNSVIKTFSFENDAKTETLLENLNDEKKELRAKRVSLRNAKEKLLTEKCNGERQIDRRELELRQLQVKLDGMSKELEQTQKKLEEAHTRSTCNGEAGLYSSALQTRVCRVDPCTCRIIFRGLDFRNPEAEFWVDISIEEGRKSFRVSKSQPVLKSYDLFNEKLKISENLYSVIVAIRKEILKIVKET
ncbi:uncharacterized protein LOC136029970 [Artemia franciscana]|uniref:uncharacterized protein LOC136029970 n=1 Tax=Artemia franciscana TaxID=6661 RepID=UPI0032DA03A8